MLNLKSDFQFGQFKIRRLIAETDLSEVYEATDAQSRRCCLKILKAPKNESLSSAQLRFRSEAAILAQINTPHVVKVLEIGMESGSAFISLEWLEGKSLKQLITEGAVEAVDLVKQVATGLAEVHAKGLLHLDIKSENIMIVQDENGKSVAKIVDFGFAGSQKTHIEGLKGTPHYIPPEQSGLVRWPVDVPTDLYSLGVVFYEAAVGRLPFVDEDPRIVIQEHLEKKPPQPSKLNPNIHPLVERIILKLLEKSPQDRYQTAQSLISDLQEALHRIETSNSSADLELDRASTKSIQLGKVFIGRKEELSFLYDLFQKTFSESLQVCFVGGFSGLGKTALLSELQNRVLVAGAHLAYGKCQEFSRGLPFYAIGEAFNNFLAKVEHYPRSSQELIYNRLKEAVGELQGDLLKIAPGFSKIFGEQTANKYETEEKASQRIKEVIVRVINAVAHKGQPLLILIDDLQWADYSSLDLISYIIEQKKSGAVYLVGTYRPEEINDEHPFSKLLEKFKTSADVNRLELKPLQKEEISELISKSIGQPKVNLPESLLTLVIDRTRGNPFYINEVLRVLLREKFLSFNGSEIVWDKDKAKNIALPDSLLQIVLARLQKMSTTEQKVLGAAAILGNPIETMDLSKITAIDPMELEMHARAMLSENIFKRNSEGVYAFYHDKVIEACRLILPEDERRETHLKCISILESRKPTENIIFALAEHSIKCEKSDLIIKYALMAGQQAASKNSLREALNYYEKALSYISDDSDLMFPTSVKYCDILIALGAYKKAEEKLESLLVKGAHLPATEKTKLHNKVAESLQRQGQYAEALKRLNHSLELIKSPIFKRNFYAGVLFDRVMTALENVALKIAPAMFDREKNAVLTDTLRRLWMVQVIYNNRPLLHISYRYLRIATRLNQPLDLATAHQYLALTVANVKKPNFKLGLHHANKAVQLSQSVGAQEIVAGALIRIAAFLTWQARSREALTYGARAREILLAVGNMWDLGNAIIFTYFSHRTLGQLQEALSSSQSLVKLGERTGSRGLVSSGSSKVAEVLFLMNNLEEAEKNLALSIETAEKFKLKFDLFQALKVGGFSRLHRRQWMEARNFFARAIKLNEEPGTSFFNAYIQEAYLGWVETYLKDKTLMQDMLRADASEIRQIKQYLANAEATEIRFREYGHVLRLKGLFEYRKGHFSRAKRHFEKSFKVFSVQERPIDLAIAEMDWGTILHEQAHPDAVAFLKRAHKKFTDVGIHFIADFCADTLKELGEETGRQSQQNSVNFEKVAQTLLDVSLAGLTSLNPREQARALLDKTIELFEAERALLFLTEGNEEPQFNLGRDRSKNDIQQPDGFSRTILTKVQTSRNPLVAANTEEGVLLGSHSVIAKNLLSMMASPILVNEELIGVLYLDNRIEKKLYRNEDGKFLQAISTQIGALLKMGKLAHLEIEKLHLEKDLELTAAVQKLLLPNDKDIELSGLNLVSYYQPANRAGGDWWWYTVAQDQSIKIYLGDVTGHGAGPAMITATIAGALRFSAHLDPKTQNQTYEVLKSLSQGLWEIAKNEFWMTMNIVEINRERTSAKLWFAAATNVYVFSKNGEYTTYNRTSSPLGSMAGTFANAEVQLKPGDKIVLCTDGIIEQQCEGGALFGEMRWLRMLRKHLQLPIKEARVKLLEDFNKLVGSVPISDDICLIIIEIK